MRKGQDTQREILSQPEVWSDAMQVYARKQDALRQLFSSSRPDQVIVSGCGSTYYLALTAARLLRQSGLDAIAFPASELLLFPDSVFLPGRKYLLLALSRSGTTTETVRACEQFKSGIGGAVITISCDGNSPLATAADITFAIDSAQEKSVAQTRSFSSMAVVAQLTAAALSDHDLSSSQRLPETCQYLLDTYGALARSLGEDERLQRFFFLGSDALYGIACEAMLKMKEMSLSYSEAFHMLEFRHGPMSMVGSDSLVVGLITASAARHEIRVLQEMQDKGATILAIGQTPTTFDHHIALPADLPAWSTPVLYLPVLQLLAYHRALHNGQNPDQPHQLSAVISLDYI